MTSCPQELADPAITPARLEQVQAELEAEQAAREAQHEQRMADRAEHERQRTGKRLGGRPPEAARARAQSLAARRNVTDPESRIMSHRGALVQGYNAQARGRRGTRHPRR